MTTFGERMRALMAERGISLRELARRTHYDAGHLSKVANSHRRVSQEMAERLDNALHADGALAALVPVISRDGMTPDDEERLLRAVEQPSWLDAYVVDSLAAILAEQRRLEDHIGSAPLIESVRAQLTTIEILVRDARGSLRPRVLEVGSQWAQFAAWLHASTGQDDDSLRCLGRALDWATEAGDAAMIGSVMSWKGYLAERNGHVASMLGLSQAAQRSRTRPGRAYDLYQEARGHAFVSDAREVDRLLDHASRAVDDSRPEDARPWEYYYFAPGFYTMEHGLVLRILGRTQHSRNDDAIRLLTQGLHDLPTDLCHSDWAGDFIQQLAIAYAQAGTPDAAAATASEAAAIARRTGSRRLLDQVRRLHTRLAARWPAEPRLAELDEQLSTAIQ